MASSRRQRAKRHKRRTPEQRAAVLARIAQKKADRDAVKQHAEAIVRLIWHGFEKLDSAFSKRRYCRIIKRTAGRMAATVISPGQLEARIKQGIEDSDRIRKGANENSTEAANSRQAGQDAHDGYRPAEL